MFGRVPLRARASSFGICQLQRGSSHVGGNPWAYLKSISDRCYPIPVAFVWELNQEIVNLPPGYLPGWVEFNRVGRRRSGSGGKGGRPNSGVHLIPAFRKMPPCAIPQGGNKCRTWVDAGIRASTLFRGNGWTHNYYLPAAAFLARVASSASRVLCPMLSHRTQSLPG